MKFYDNFSELNLLFSQPVHFTIYETNRFSPITTFELQMPTFKLFSFNENLRYFVSLINAPISDLQKQFPNIVDFQTHYQLILGLILLQHPTLTQFLDVIIDALRTLGINATTRDSKGSIGLAINGVLIDEPLFTRIMRIILIALALKKQSDFVDDPQLQAYQEKINRIKSQNKSVTGNSTDFNKAFMILTYEFGYKPEEILNMTQYTINFILGYTGKSINYKLSLIAAGNGNTKKVKFITDKGR